MVRPVDLLGWEDIRTIEVRRRSPFRTAFPGMGIGGILGVIGGVMHAHRVGNDDLVEGFWLGVAGGFVGGTIGFGVGLAVPIWEPLYRAP